MIPRNTSNRTRLRGVSRLLGALACACFWFQQLLVPLHLALHEHTLLGGQGQGHAEHAEHGHGHEDAHVHLDGHDHEHELAARAHDGAGPWLGQSPGSHDPHPSEDHLVQSTEAAVLPNLAHALLAPEPARHGRAMPEPAARGLILHEEVAPRPPPPGSAAEARAPPVAS